MIRFRLAIANYTTKDVTHRWSDRWGHLAYTIGQVAFVALSRGYSWYTKHGPNITFDLATVNLTTELPDGTYCNMAAFSLPLRNDDDAKACNKNDMIIVDDNGTIKSGQLPSGGMVAIHSRYPATKVAPGAAEDIAERPVAMLV